MWNINLMLATFKALADPHRLQIVDLLRRKPLPVGTVAERLGLLQPQASKHLRVLSLAGLVEARPEAQRRLYALRTQPFEELDGWLERYRSAFEHQFEQLDAVLEKIQRAGKKKARPRRQGA